MRFAELPFVKSIRQFIEATADDLRQHFPHITWTTEYPDSLRIVARIKGQPPASDSHIASLPSITSRPVTFDVSPHSYQGVVIFISDDLSSRPFRSTVDVGRAGAEHHLAKDLKASLDHDAVSIMWQRARINAIRAPKPTGIGSTVTIQHQNGTKETIHHVNVGQTSDGSHTFQELYEHRYWLFLALGRCHAVEGTKNPAWISKKHHDGTMYPGCFIAGLTVAPGEHITYHLPIELVASVSVGNAQTDSQTPPVDITDQFTPLTFSMWDAAIEAGFSVIDKAPPWNGLHDSLDKLCGLAKRKDNSKLRAVWIVGSCWELRDETGECILTESRNAGPDEAECTFRSAYPDADIEMDTSDWDEYQRDYCQD